MALAQLNYRRTLVLAGLLGLCLCYTRPLFAEGPAPELVDPSALDAYKNFWETFSLYQKQLIREGQKKYQKGWQDLNAVRDRESTSDQAQVIEKLKGSAEQYRKQLRQYPQAENRPFVLLNLAQVLLLLGEQEKVAGRSGSHAAFQEAVSVVDEIKWNHRHFSRTPEAFYVQAIALTAQERKDEAFKVWHELAQIAGANVYGILAQLAIGDHHFYKEKPLEAAKHYESALQLVAQSKDKSLSDYRVLGSYRLAWAAYRGGQLDKAVTASAILLNPVANLRNGEEFQQIQLDAVQILADSLYEQQDLPRILAELNKRDIAAKATAVAVQCMRRFMGAKQHSKAITIGETVLKEYALSPDLPDLLTVLASCYQSAKQTNSYLATLEKLSLLLPKNSLWRTKQQGALKPVERMEDLAGKATKAAAFWYYDRGVSSNSPRFFLSAAALFKILIDARPQDPEAKEWRLKSGHCFYFARNLEDAAQQYTSLLEDIKLPAKTLQTASYQLVLANEKMWHRAFNQALEKGLNPQEDVETISKLTGLEKAIENYNQKFLGQTRAVDILLIGAGANRDVGRLDRARQFWEKSLLGQPSVHQRALALRGIVFSYLKSGSAGELIDTVRRYLRLEDWQKLGHPLRKEFLTILSQATLAEGKRLTEAGSILEGGTLLARTAVEFVDVPHRSRMLRDGAYYLAIAGEWSLAQKAVKKYLEAGIREDQGDMLYLLARSYEFQLRFTQAAQGYWQFARAYPGHNRATVSLQRAYSLALAENNFALAGDAANFLVEKAPVPRDKLTYLKDAFSAYMSGKNYNKAAESARRRLALSKTPADRLESRLLQAKATLAEGLEERAITSLVNIANEAKQQKSTLGEEGWSTVAGEANVLLAQEAFKKFKSIDLWQEESHLASRIPEKMKHFRELENYYQTAAGTSNIEWAAQARFKLAETAEKFGDEIAGITQRNEGLPVKTREHFRNEVSQLRTLAKNLYSQNLVAHTKDPSEANSSAWLQKSSMRLSGIQESDQNRAESRIPYAVQLELPYQWSL